MINLRKIFFWTFLILFVTACDGNIQTKGVSSCRNFSVSIKGRTTVAPNTVVKLSADPAVGEWNYNWMAEKIEGFVDSRSSLITFRAPSVVGSYPVFVQVKESANCNKEVSTIIEVLDFDENSSEYEIAEVQTVSPTITATVSPTATATSTKIPTIKPSSTPEPTPLLEPTVTTTPTTIPTPTEQPKPSSTPITNIAVTLVNAENRGSSFNLSWAYEGSLESDMYFAVRVGQSGDVHSRYWGNEPPYEFSFAVGPGTEFGEGDYEWYVVVVRDLVPDGSGADGKWQEITRSNMGTFHVPFIPTPNPSSPPQP